MSGTSLNHGELRELTWGWWLAWPIGAASIVAGAIVILKPSNSLSTLAVIFGIFILVAGILELIAALGRDPTAAAHRPSSHREVGTARRHLDSHDHLITAEERFRVAAAIH